MKLGKNQNRYAFFSQYVFVVECKLGLWCLTPLSTIFQLHRVVQFYWLKILEKTTDLPQVIDKLTLSHNVV